MFNVFRQWGQLMKTTLTWNRILAPFMHERWIRLPRNGYAEVLCFFGVFLSVLAVPVLVTTHRKPNAPWFSIIIANGQPWLSVYLISHLWSMICLCNDCVCLGVKTRHKYSSTECHNGFFLWSTSVVLVGKCWLLSGWITGFDQCT